MADFALHEFGALGTNGIGVGVATGVGEIATEGDSVGLGDGVSSTATEGAASARTSVDEIAATVKERVRELLKTDIQLKIDWRTMKTESLAGLGLRWHT
jgi:hypothetical protein